MLYVIIGTDVPDSLGRRQAAREDHLARIRALRDQGRLAIAGPCPAVDARDPGPAGFTGSVIIAEFDDLAAARQWAGEDPYLAAGAWSGVQVRPFIQVLP
jgi:uncharacterized protein YciI